MQFYLLSELFKKVFQNKKQRSLPILCMLKLMFTYGEDSPTTTTRTKTSLTMETKAAANRSRSTTTSSTQNVTKTPLPSQADSSRFRRLKTDSEDLSYSRHCYSRCCYSRHRYYKFCYFDSVRYVYFENFSSCNLGLHVLKICGLDLI